MRTSRALAKAGTAFIAAITLGTGVAAAAEPEPELMSRGFTSAGETHGGVVSDSGERVAFIRPPTNPELATRVYVRDWVAGTTTMAYRGWNGYVVTMDFSGDGYYVAATAKSPASTYSLRVRSVETGKTTYLGRDFTKISKPSVSYTGRWVAFTGTRKSDSRSNAYRWDSVTNSLTRVTNGSGVSNAVISSSGKRVAYSYQGHAFARTVATRETIMVDARSNGTPGNAANAVPTAFSANGDYVLFTSAATNLTGGTGACDDEPAGCAFRRLLSQHQMAVASVLPNGAVHPVSDVGHSTDLSADGRIVAFSVGENAFARRLATRVTKHVSTNGDVGTNVRDVSVNAYGSAVTYTTVVSAVSDKPSVWLAGPDFY